MFKEVKLYQCSECGKLQHAAEYLPKRCILCGHQPETHFTIKADVQLVTKEMIDDLNKALEDTTFPSRGD